MLDGFWFESWFLFFTFLGMGGLGAIVQPRQDDEGEKPQRRKSRSRDEKGLPDPKTLRELAKTYLDMQCRLWPDAVKSGMIRRATNAEIEKLVLNFEDRFLHRASVASLVWEAVNWCVGLAAAYLRFSCDKSNPRSLVQQLKLVLDKAAGNGHFIPWEFVFCDAGVSGTTSDRIGYQLANQTLENVENHVVALYIDEIGRASRDMVEALRLGSMIDSQGQILIGVSDGFDSRSPMAKLMLSVFAALQEWFVDQLRSKVYRGMRDAHDRGTNIRPAAIGYKLVPALDAEGRPVFGRDGEHLNALAIDEEAADVIRVVFDRFVTDKWSLSKIGRWLNEVRFGAQQWDASRIKQLLTRYKYVGIDVENMTRIKRVKDRNGRTKKSIIKRPRNEWKVKRARHLQIVEWKVWKAAQARSALSTRVYAKKPLEERLSRVEFNRTTLVRPVCGCCGNEMVMGSSGDFPTFTCANARHGKQNCTYRGYKSSRQIEKAVVAHVLNVILTEDRMAELAEKANAFLKAEAAKPRVDTGGWKRELKKTEQSLNHLTAILEQEGTNNLTYIVEKVRKHEERMLELRKLIREAESSRPTVQRLVKQDVVNLLANVREILSGEVAQAAHLLREITGPVVIHLKEDAGRKRPVWTAVFTVNLVPVCLRLARETKLPTTSVWEFLNTSGWKLPFQASIVLEKRYKYEIIAADALRLHEAGQSVDAIAAVLGVYWMDVKRALDFAINCKRPVWEPQKSRNKGPHRKKPNAYHGHFREISEDVVRLREEEKYSWSKIQQWLETERTPPVVVSTATIRKAYDFARREVFQKAVASGGKPHRGAYSHLGMEKERQIRQHLTKGLSDKEIVAKTGVWLSTVMRRRKAFEN